MVSKNVLIVIANTIRHLKKEKKKKKERKKEIDFNSDVSKTLLNKIILIKSILLKKKKGIKKLVESNYHEVTQLTVIGKGI